MLLFVFLFFCFVFVIKWRPSKLLPTYDLETEIRYWLTAIFTIIDNNSVAFLQLEIFCNLRYRDHHMSHKLFIFFLDLWKRLELLIFGNHDEMNFCHSAIWFFEG